ncbi:MAG: elongation factor G [Acidobacteriota bacterium]
MKIYDAPNIRNVALVGHGGSGKTSLTSAMLYCAGAVNRLGKVDQGNTVTDYDDEEIARRISLSSSLAYCEWNKRKINIIDTPGYGNFIWDTWACMRVVEGVVVAVCGVAGVEVQTEKVWKFAEDFALPRLIVINKLDRERASLDRAMESVHAVFGRKAVPVQIPLGEEKDMCGVVDLLRMKAYEYVQDESGKFKEIDIPADLSDLAQKRRSELVELVAETDDKLMEKFFEAGELTAEEVGAGLREAVRKRAIYPVFAASALMNIGVHQILSAVTEFFPSPAEVPVPAARNSASGEPVALKPSDGDQLAAYVFKTIADPYAGRITMLRVYSGTLKADSTVYNANRTAPEKMGAIGLLLGKQQTFVAEVKAGDMAAATKLKETVTGDTLCTDKTKTVEFEAPKFPQASISYALTPKSRADEEKISSALARLLDEDPTMRITRDPQTHEMLVSGNGQLHLEVLVAKLKRRFGVDVVLQPPKVPYRETIKGRADVQGRYKRQSGGRGQYGDCKAKFEPLPRGKDFEFADEIFGGSIPKNYIPAVEKGIQEARTKGFLAGYPMVDFKVILYDGSFHPVDSSDMAFKIAGSLAFKKAMDQAQPTLLEPIVNVEITAPEAYMGDLMGDLNGRRGRVQGMEPRGSVNVIKAAVPMAEMLNYEQSLNSVTGGRGSYQMEFSHYEEVPAHLQPKIIEAAKAEGRRVGGEEEE